MPEYEHKSWPSWRYGPEGQSQIFDHEEQVPDGWEDHPSKVSGHRKRDRVAAEVKTARQGSVSSDPTLAGDENINRGQPETLNQPGATQGGETGQPTDKAVFSLPKEGDVDKNWITEQLNARKVPHNPRWDKSKLYGLLHDAVSPAD